MKRVDQSIDNFNEHRFLGWKRIRHIIWT